ncbi:hypothetical protein SAMN05216249_10252 [Acetitomaculum ruminis DSM 5522]|uniref:Uncharacterized protein n=1 Tax=Acetitomaculum ruminis DSM 5522 TaxID=1120918 RepID=A0A1I0VJE6_9FIRM|nr:hypothetical protein [Acetitomaculum ruminis]SFA76629.1 hypothetical protein SAMN05216249_10252 [Acetitomaculum ruminis DSM 5522]
MKQPKILKKRLNRYKNIISTYSSIHEYALLKTLDNMKKSDFESLIFSHVYAPVMTEFILNVLFDAKKNGVKRLYFLSRDGFMMYESALYFNSSFNLNLDIRYLELSRFSLRKAEYNIIKKESLEYICAESLEVTFDRIMKRALLSKKEAEKIAEMTDFKGKEKLLLNKRELSLLKDKLRKSALFFKYIYQHSKDEFHTTYAYFKEKGMLECVDYALVDSGWRGSIQKSLERIIKKPLKGYYFGLYELDKRKKEDFKACILDYKSWNNKISDVYNKSVYKCFYIIPQKGRDLYKKATFSICLFESVFSSNEAMTLGYKRFDEKITPQKNIVKNPNGDRIIKNLETLKTYQKYYTSRHKKNLQSPISGLSLNYQNNKKSLVFIEKLLSLHMHIPVYPEVKTMGTYLFCDDVLEHSYKKLALSYETHVIENNDILKRILIKLNLKSGKLISCGWIEGSIVLSTRNPYYHIFNEFIYNIILYTIKGL